MEVANYQGKAKNRTSIFPGNAYYFLSRWKVEKSTPYARTVDVVAISLWSDPLEKTFEKLCSAVLSQGTRLKTSGDPEISDEKKVREELARKNLRDLEKQKCSKYTAPAK